MGVMSELLREAGGQADATGQLLKGYALQPVAGLGGLGRTMIDLMRGRGIDASMKAGADTVENISGWGGGPLTQRGAERLQGLGGMVEGATQKVGDALGNPIDKLGEVPVVGPGLAAAGLGIIEAAPGPGKAKSAVRAADRAAPRAQALREAQINAAKPVSEGGLGLHPNNTPMERAQAMGFDLERPLYHGSLHDIKNVDVRKSSSEGHAGQGFYTTPDTWDASNNYASPKGPDISARIQQAVDDAENPNTYEGYPRTSKALYEGKLSDDRLMKVLSGTGTGEHLGAVYPVYVRHGNEANIVDPKKSKWIEPGEVYDEVADAYTPGPDADKWSRASNVLEEMGADMPDAFSERMMEGAHLGDIWQSLKGYLDTSHGNYMTDMGDLASPGAVATEAVREMGADTVTHPTRFRNAQLNTPKGHTVVLDPTAVRSRFAAFDPAKRNSSDILGAATPEMLALTAGVTGGGMALANAIREQEKEKKK